MTEDIDEPSITTKVPTAIEDQARLIKISNELLRRLYLEALAALKVSQ